jgi:hypothetical protein
MSNYYEWEGFENIYFEDSFVLGIDELPNKIIFTVNAALLEKHQLYTPPNPKEYHCCKKIRIIFSGLKKINWNDKDMRPSIDAAGVIDYGNIDTFQHKQEGYYLEGDFGTMIIESDKPTIEYI